jgi:hypothetical protein
MSAPEVWPPVAFEGQHVTVDHRARAWRLFVETHGLVFGRLVDELKAETGLPITWYDVLFQLQEVPGQTAPDA